MNWSDWLDDLWIEFCKEYPSTDPNDKSLWLTPDVYNNPQDDDLGGHLYDFYNAGMNSKLAAEKMLYIET